MNTKTNIARSLVRLAFALALLSTLNPRLSTCLAQGTAFTYQGRLTDGTNAANGNYDLTFSVWSAASGPSQIGSAQTNRPVAVSNGLFTVVLDFGSGIFTGAARWLEIGVRTNGSVGAYTSLGPRQPLSAAPYAVMAGNAGNLGGQSSSAFVAKSGDTMTGALNLPANGLVVGANQLTVAGGKVGIGTSTPSAPLALFTTSSDVLFKMEDRRADVSFSRFKSKESFYDYGGEAAYIALEHNFGEGPVPRALVFGTSADGNAPTEKMRITRAGNVGIGTTSPQARLEIVSPSDVISSEFLRLANGPGSTDYHSIRSFFHGGAGKSSLGFKVEYATGDIREVLTLTGNAVGIGTSDPTAPLHIQGPRAYARFVATNDPAGSILELKNTTQGPNVTLGQVTFRDAVDNVQGRIRYDADTGLEFSVGGAPQANLDAAGTLSVKVLQINGADVAEPFELSTKDIPKGSAVIIDEENPGQLKLSERAYDNRVAGILSGANGVNSGILLSQRGFNDRGQNVALSGRVYAQADASFGAIKPGDLLTTSDTPGHCMKVTDPARAQGAIIGKAMSALDQGKGMVLVLVTLQ